MSVTQLSVFVQNKRGRITELVSLLAANDINIFAFSVADVSDYGIVRVLAEHARRAHTVLTEAGFTTKADPVVSVPLVDKVGSLAKVLELVTECGATIDYLYLSARMSVVLRVDDVDAVERRLVAAGFAPLNEQEVD
ncbi:MAG: amino acid-binding protein [Actinobacteria bacterium]|nr:amino acid-binding protein [Actinomycetota bacterium]